MRGGGITAVKQHGSFRYALDSHGISNGGLRLSGD